MTRHVWLVIRREWNQRARSKAFLISTVVSAAFIVAIIVVPDILGGNSARSRTVGMVGQSSPQLPAALQAAGRQLGLTVSTRQFDARTSGEEALRAGDVDVLLLDQGELLWKSNPDQQLSALTNAAVGAIEQEHAVVELGLTPSQQQALQPPALASSSLEPVSEERDARMELAMVGLVVLLLAISFYGGFLLVGVIEEKASRTIEVLLSRLRPVELLSGKIVGIGLAGLAQIGVVAVAALVALTWTDTGQLPSTTGGTIGWTVLWFLLGYGFYAVLYGAAGSLVSRQEDAQSMTFPVTAVLLVAYIFAMEATRSPDGTVAVIASFVPPTAPLVMLVRIASGSVPWWQITISILVMLASIAALLVLAGRIYAGAALRLGGRVKLREAWLAADLSTRSLEAETQTT